MLLLAFSHIWAGKLTGPRNPLILTIFIFMSSLKFHAHLSMKPFIKSSTGPIDTDISTNKLGTMVDWICCN